VTVPGWQECPGPAVTYGCDDPAVPDAGEGFSCLQFSVALPATTGHDYCCAPPDTCFGGPYRPLLPCASWADQIFCTGTALPAGETCVEAAFDGGAGLRGFCCTGIGDAGRSDGAEAG